MPVVLDTVRTCVCARVCARVRLCVCVCVCVCSFINLTKLRFKNNPNANPCSQLRTYIPGLYFGVLNALLGPAKGRAERTTPWNNFACGAGARCIATTIMLPLTVVKTRFEALRGHQYKG